MTDVNNKRTDAVDHAARMINRISTAGNRTAIYEQLYDAGYSAGTAGGGYPPELLTLTDRLLADITELRCGLEEAITLCDLNFPEWYATNGNERLDACRLILETTGGPYRPEQPEVTVAGEICPGCGCRIFHPSAICQPAPGGENDAL